MNRPVSPVIWSSTLDDRYSSSVTRLSLHQGVLKIMDGEQPIYERVVPLSSALYSPDPSEVFDWASKIYEVISERNQD